MGNQRSPFGGRPAPERYGGRVRGEYKVPGGKLVSVDELGGTAELEVSPGNVVKVHRQTLVKVVDPAAATISGDAPRSVEEAMEIAEREQQAREGSVGGPLDGAEDDLDEPRYGERIHKEQPSAEDGDEGDAPKKS